MAKSKNNNTDNIILDRFSTTDLTRWNRLSELHNEYYVKLFFHLEGLRTVHRNALCDSLRDADNLNSLDEREWWRIVDHQYANAPLSAKGSVIKGARFNVGKDLDRVSYEPFPVLYIAETEDTAMKEKFGDPVAANGLTGPELSLRTRTSYTAVRVRLNLDDVFDLTNAKHLRAFTEIISKFQLTGELKKLAKKIGIKPPYLVSKPSDLRRVILGDWSYFPVQFGIPANSQIFGSMLRDAGYKGILFPSTKNKKCRNVGVFVENLEASNSFVELMDKAPDSVECSRLDQSNWMDLY